MIRLKASGASTFGKWRMPGDFLVAAARHEAGEPAVFARRGAGIVGAAHDQHRDAQRRQLRGEVEIHDRRRAPQKARGRRRRDGVADLLPAPGFFALKASVNQRSIVPSASGSSEFARRTVFIRSSHIAAAPDGLAGKVSHHIAEISLAPCSIAKAWPIMPPIDRPI